MKASAAAASKAELWRELVLRQKKSGLTVEAFCQQQGVSGWSFYQWRKRLAMKPPMSFALVETREASRQGTGAVELWLNGGDRLQIAPGVDAATLRTVLAVLRERQ
ncbi:MAG: hypothetical protein ABSC15_27005 [Terriglobales bacterium]|jgi:hypothetical protein